MSTPPPTREDLNEAAADMCSLVMPVPPTVEDLAAMSTRAVQEIENWAGLQHLRASDCNIPEVEIPTALREWFPS